MTKAKVGDYIKVTDSGDNLMFYREGAGGKVVRVDDQCALVSFTHGEFNKRNGGQWWIEHGKYTVEKPYSSTFTQAAKAEAPQGHTADGGGLQKHSIGGLYPLCVVGYHNGESPVAWVVENLQDGTVACTNGGSPRQWNTLAVATVFASRCKEHTGGSIGEPIVWLKGRPHFAIEHRLSELLSLKTAQG